VKDNVLYVTPDGIAFKESDFNAVKEKVKQAWDGIKELLSEVVQGICDRLKLILSRSNPSQKKADNSMNMKPFKHSWRVPMSTVKHSQVMSKKPMFATARNNI